MKWIYLSIIMLLGYSSIYSLKAFSNECNPVPVESFSLYDVTNDQGERPYAIRRGEAVFNKQKNMGVCYAAASATRLMRHLWENNVLDKNEILSLSDTICQGNNGNYKEGDNPVIFLYNLAQRGSLAKECEEVISHKEISKNKQKFLTPKEAKIWENIGESHLKKCLEDLVSMNERNKKGNVVCSSNELLGGYLLNNCKKRSIKLPPFNIMTDMGSSIEENFNIIKQTLKEKKRMLGLSFPNHETNVYGYYTLSCVDKLGKKYQQSFLKIFDSNGKKVSGKYEMSEFLSDLEEINWIENSKEEKTKIKGPLAVNYYAKISDHEMLKEALRESSNPNKLLFNSHPLYFAYTNKDEESLRILLKDPRIDPNFINPQIKDTIFNIAVAKDQGEIIKIFLENEKTNVNASGYSGVAPLMTAIVNQNTPLTKLLLTRKDLDPNIAEPKEGLPALSLALSLDNYSLIQLLIHLENINHNQPDKRGLTPLYYALENDQYDSAELIINKLKEKNIPLASPDENGNTLLHLAAMNKGNKTIEVLINKNSLSTGKIEGFDVNQANKLGATPLHLAIKSGSEKVLMNLIRADNIDVNKPLKDKSPLYLASELGHISMVKDLLQKKGIIIDNAAISIAEKNNYREIVRILKEAQKLQEIK